MGAEMIAFARHSRESGNPAFAFVSPSKSESQKRDSRFRGNDGMKNCRTAENCP
jgi:hypothetical protein